jgi:hypothetical protein
MFNSPLGYRAVPSAAPPEAGDDAEEGWGYSCAGCAGEGSTIICISNVRRTVIVAVSVGVCLAAYLQCYYCLFAVIGICSVVCWCDVFMNIPLWLAILLLLYGGWTFTSESLVIRWRG